MHIEQYLGEKKLLIDREIEKIIPRKITEQWLEKILGKARYRYDAETVTKSLAEPIWDFLDRGGKRWRPALTLLACEAVGGKEKDSLPFTPIPELIHNGCVTGDTQIWMADGTIKEIKDIKDGETVLSLQSDGKISSKKVVKKHYNGEKEVFKVRTGNRKLEATVNHPFLTAKKQQPRRMILTEKGKKEIRNILGNMETDISNYSKQLYQEIKDKNFSFGHLRNALYGWSTCMLPKDIAKMVSEQLSLNFQECWKEVQCKYEQAEIIFEWKKTEELHEGDLLVIARDVSSEILQGEYPKLEFVAKNPKDRFTVPQKFSTELAQLCGFLVGDGYIDFGRVCFCQPENTEGRLEYVALVEKVFGASPSPSKNDFTICSKSVASLFKNLEIAVHSKDAYIPEWVFRLPKEEKLAFVSGYLDADGIVSKEKVTFACKSKKLIYQMKALLDSLGFVASNVWKHEVDNTHFTRPVKNPSTLLYGFSVFSKSKFKEEIGTELITYNNRLMQVQQREKTFRHSELIPSMPKGFSEEQLGFSKIRSIEKIGTKETYDVQIEDTHNYISNGIVTHNTIMADDIEDDAKERRGKPCTHIIYGIDIALNASNIMYFLPMTIFYTNSQRLEPEKVRQIYDLYIQEMMRVSIGQAKDIYWHKGKKADLTEQHYLQMCICKTGVLARFAAELGAIIGNSGREKIDALARFGESLGVGFQIQDDILELVGKKFAKGKGGIGGDIHEGKRTLMVIHALRNANEKDRKRLVEILDSHPTDQKTINEAIDSIKKNGSIEYAKNRAQEIVAEALAELENKLPESKAKKMLKELADYCIGRKI